MIDIERLRLQLVSTCKRNYEKARSRAATEGDAASRAILAAEHLIQATPASPDGNARAWLDALLASLEAEGAKVDDPHDPDGRAAGALRTIIREATTLRDRTFKLGKYEGTFQGGFVGAAVFGLWGLLVCHFVGKPATKRGAAYGFIARFAGVFLVVLVALAFSDPHARAPKWQTYHLPAGFHVDLPDTPEAEDFTDPPGRRLMVERSSSYSEAGWIDVRLPPEEDLVHRVFERVADSEASARDTTVETSEALPFGENPGRAFRFAAIDGITCVYRMGAMGTRLVYALSCGTASQSTLGKRVTSSLAPDPT